MIHEGISFHFFFAAIFKRFTRFQFFNHAARTIQLVYVFDFFLCCNHTETNALHCHSSFFFIIVIILILRLKERKKTILYLHTFNYMVKHTLLLCSFIQYHFMCIVLISCRSGSERMEEEEGKASL